jgi:hypothetical protein
VTGTFHDRMDELRQRTMAAEEHITGRVDVNQIYAHYQHEHLEFRHPRGGRARYLAQPLMDNHRRYLTEFADTGDGGVARHAPVEFGDLRASGAPSVRTGHRELYSRPPHMHRLDSGELKAKSRAEMAIRRLLGLPVFWMSHGKIMVSGGSKLNIWGRS